MKFTFRSHKGRLGFVTEALPQKKIRLLDVGNLGDGESTCSILKKIVEENGGTYYGLDSNEALTKKMDLPHQIIGDLHATKLPDQSFDVIYAGEIIEHTWTPGVMIAECYRLLSPEGMLILDTPNPYNILAILRFLLKREDSMGDNRTLTYYEAKRAFHQLQNKGEILLQPQHKIFFTPAMMKQLLETHGFALRKIGCTRKARNFLHRLLLTMFPHSGPHLCIVAQKSTIDAVFDDIAHAHSMREQMDVTQAQSQLRSSR